MTAPTSSPAHNAAPSHKKKLPLRQIILLTVVLVAAGVGIKKALYYRDHITTDDAQIESTVLSILPRTSGFVEKVYVKDDQFVHQGDTLVVLERRELMARYHQAQADELAAEIAAKGGIASAAILVAESQKAAINANLQGVIANAERAHKELERIQKLNAQDISSKSQLDAAEAAARTADATLRATQDQVVGAQSSTQGAQAQLRQADAKLVSIRATLELLKLQMEYSVILAPSNGYVTKKNVEIGQLINVGQPLLSLVSDTKPWVVANLKETQIEDLKVGMNTEIEVDTYSGHVFKGHVRSIQRSTGSRFSLLAADNASGNFTKVVQRVPVRIDLDEYNDQETPLRPGMSVNVSIIKQSDSKSTK